MKAGMKRVVSVMLALALCTSLWMPAGAAKVNDEAQAKAKVMIGSGTIAAAGGEVKLPVTVSFKDDATALSTVALTFEYDTKALVLEDIDLGTRREPTILYGATVNAQEGIVAWTTADEELYITSESISESGEYATDVLAYLVFKTTEAYLNDTYQITCGLTSGIEKNFGCVQDPVDFYVVAGEVTLKGGLDKDDLKPTITTQPASASYTYNADIAPLSVAATVPGICEGVTYQWYKNDAKIDGATEATYQPEQIYGTTSYYCVVSTTYNDQPFTTTSKTAQITYSKAALDQNKFSLDNAQFVYDGTAKSVAVVADGLTAGEDYTVSGTQSATNVGNYTIAITGKGNYEGQVTKNWTIERASVAVPVAADDLTYNGQDQTGVPAGEGYAVDGNTAKDAGTYTAVAVLDNNHKWADGTTTDKNISWSIAPKSVAAQWSNTELTYNGKVQVPTATVDTGIDAETLVVNVSGGEKNVGENYTASASVVNKNYTLEASGATTSFSIAAKSVDVVWSNTTLTYNGKEQVPAAAVETGIAGETLTPTVTGAKKDAGSYTATAAIDNANYKLNNATASFVIETNTQITDVTVKEQNVVIEVGNFAEPKFAGVDGEAVNGTTTYTYKGETKTAAQINADLQTLAVDEEVEIAYSFVADGNYAGTKTGTIKVKMVSIIYQVGGAAATINNAVTIKADATYGDSWEDIVKINTIAASVNGVPVAGQYKLDVTGKPDAGQQGFKVLFTADNDTRYQNVEVVSGTMSVAAKKVAVEWDSTALTYNGQAQAPTGTYKNISDADIPVIVTGTQTNVGEGYTATATTEDTNYELTGNTTTFAITPAQMDATVTVEASSDSIIKDTVLTAHVTGTYDVLAYQWLKDGQIIEGATNESYTIGDGMSGSFVSVQVTSSGNYVGTITSAGTEVGKIVLTATVTIAGETAVGSELTATVIGECDCDIVWLADGVLIENASGSPYIVAKADQGKTITAKIVGKGDYTGEAISNGIAIPAGRPDAVELTAKGSSKKVTLSWTAPANNGAAITGYQVKMDGEGQEWIEVAADKTSYVFEGLENGTEYTFYIKAINAAGESDEATVTAKPKAAPSGGGGGGGITPVKPTEPEQPKDTVTTKTDAAGNKVTTTEKVDGSVEVKAELNNKAVTDAAKNGTAVELPMDPVTVGAKETVVTINTGAKEEVKVEIPVAETTSGTVAVLVKADGTEQIIRDSVVTENGVAVNVSDGDKIVIKDNSKEFKDVADHWGKGAVNFVTARGLFAGVGNGIFDPDVATNRGMIVQVLHNLEYNAAHHLDGHGFHDVGDHHWYDDAVHWAEDNGVVGGYPDGSFQGEKKVTREELVVMLWNYAGKQAGTGSDYVSAFNDAANVSDWAKIAMNWALENGVLGGKGGKVLDPTGFATRAELAQMMKNYLENI